ncbi:hypothetical protein ABW19_dt0207853 [Dactylella cylindrospora]|nr:hypothetical protein ABW19_dt0207853 [Dactylella cylindrospora]
MFALISHPRFFIHPEIAALERAILAKYGLQRERCMLFPSKSVASRCNDFILSRLIVSEDKYLQSLGERIRLLDLTLLPDFENLVKPRPDICVVFFPEQLYPSAKEFWQHTGEGVSSRRAVFVHACLDRGHLSSKDEQTADSQIRQTQPRGPRRYSKQSPLEGTFASNNGVYPPAAEGTDTQYFVERRYGRNLEASAVHQATLAIKQRISGSMDPETPASVAPCVRTRAQRLSPSDVFLFPTGMSAIYNAHRLVLSVFGPKKMVEFGFPYIDTLKVLQKFGNGCIFFGNGDEGDLDALEQTLQAGEAISALFCEFPSNPLLKSPNLRRIRGLADSYGFVIVVDETIGNFVNVDMLPYADILVSSLTKVFSGDSNVMGGSCIINPLRPHYKQLISSADKIFEGNYWDEDLIFMERNSRDFVSRVLRINTNAEALAELFLKWSRIVSNVFYPKNSETKENYDRCRCAKGGYGGLLSVTFHRKDDAIQFYDLVDTAKGPSLGTNFTLTSPYALLAHYNELDWIAGFGVESHLVRISVGLEEPSHLLSVFENALRQIALKHGVA